MTWNTSNDDILAVGYGEYGFTNQKSGEAFQNKKFNFGVWIKSELIVEIVLF